MEQCPLCESKLDHRRIDELLGLLSCPTCHLNFRWKPKQRYSWLATLSLLFVLSPFIYFMSFLASFLVILMSHIALKVPLSGTSFPCLVTVTVAFLAQVAVLNYLTRPWFRQLQPVATAASREYWSRYCPVCRQVPPDDAITFDETKVCAGCKDTYVQQLKEGLIEPGGSVTGSMGFDSQI